MAKINLENVKGFIEKSGKSEPEFAEAMGIDYSYLFRVLRHDRQAGGKFIEGLLKVGMKPNDIFLLNPMTKVKAGIENKSPITILAAGNE